MKGKSSMQEIKLYIINSTKQFKNLVNFQHFQLVETCIDEIKIKYLLSDCFCVFNSETVLH